MSAASTVDNEQEESERDQENDRCDDGDCEQYGNPP
jgi:hypothetical protein